jgi:DNA/RNA endonuclease G (NUC1)
MVPQLPNLNRITWRALENYSRTLAKTYTVTITCGVIGSLGKMVGVDSKKIKHPSNINIPAKCWKRLVYDNGMTEFYVMPNSDTVSRHPFKYYLQFKERQ